MGNGSELHAANSKRPTTAVNKRTSYVHKHPLFKPRALPKQNSTRSVYAKAIWILRSSRLANGSKPPAGEYSIRLFIGQSVFHEFRPNDSINQRVDAKFTPITTHCRHKRLQHVFLWEQHVEITGSIRFLSAALQHTTTIFTIIRSQPESWQLPSPFPTRQRQRGDGETDRERHIDTSAQPATEAAMLGARMQRATVLDL